MVRALQAPELIPRCRLCIAHAGSADELALPSLLASLAPKLDLDAFLCSRGSRRLPLLWELPTSPKCHLCSGSHPAPPLSSIDTLRPPRACCPKLASPLCAPPELVLAGPWPLSSPLAAFDARAAPPPPPLDEDDSLRTCFTKVEAEATTLRARVEWLEHKAVKRDELLSALLAATRLGNADLRHSCLGSPPPLRRALLFCSTSLPG